MVSKHDVATRLRTGTAAIIRVPKPEARFLRPEGETSWSELEHRFQLNTLVLLAATSAPGAKPFSMTAWLAANGTEPLDNLPEDAMLVLGTTPDALEVLHMSEVAANATSEEIIDAAIVLIGEIELGDVPAESMLTISRSHWMSSGWSPYIDSGGRDVVEKSG